MTSDLSNSTSGPLLVEMMELCSRIGKDSLQRDFARKRLAELDPNVMVRLAYGSRYRKYRIGPFWKYIIKEFPTPWQFVHWVYKDDSEKLSAAYKDRSWLKVASKSDTLAAVVDRLLGEVKPRYKWMWRRTLYGYAFGQSRGADKYTRKVIHPYKGKRRVLHVPYKPLARVQKALLRLVLNPAQDTLPRYVMGGRSSGDGQRGQFGIFQNAAAHVGQGFVASFDIKDFFPSIRLSDIVQALQTVPCAAIDDNGSPMPWTDDSAVFVARLVTRRGRLPQGAPTSPAIANLAFRHYDEIIRDRLGADFVYTRYFDDLTVSISAHDARANKLETVSRFRDHVAKVISQTLTHSSFRLNGRKTRCGDGTAGVVVTGLRVDSVRVNVARSLRRKTRALLHRIESTSHGFTATALHYYSNSCFFDTHFHERHDCHRDDTRRLSTERMAVMAVRHLCGDLKIEIPSSVVFEGGRRIAKDVELHEGKQAYRDVTYLLSKVWQLHLSTDSDEGHVIFRDADKRIIARLRCERNDGFFLLEKKSAFACLELWHRLHGLWSGMNPCSHEAVFRGIHEFREQVRRSLDRVSIPREQHRPVLITPPKDEEIITLDTSPAGEIHRNAGPLWSLLSAFRDVADVRSELSPSVAGGVSTFKTPITTIDEFAQWLQNCREAVKAMCTMLPSEEKDSIWYTLQILDDRFSGKRSAFYDVEKVNIRSASFKFNHQKVPRYDGAIRLIPVGVAAWLQARLVLGMRQSLQDSLNTFRNEGREAWLKKVDRNSDTDSIEKRVTKGKQRLVAAIGAARWKTTNKPLVSAKAFQLLSDNLEKHFRMPLEEAFQVVFDELWAFAAAVFGPICEQLRGDDATVSDVARERLIKQFGQSGSVSPTGGPPGTSDLDPLSTSATLSQQLQEELFVEIGKSEEVFKMLQLMRNRHSHATDRGKHVEWVRLIRYVAQALGRYCDLEVATVKARGETNFSYATDLPLSPLEAVEVMITICDRLIHALENLVPRANSLTYVTGR